MNKRNVIMILIFITAIGACTKKSVDAVLFNVSTDSTYYNVGDTVIFKLTGNPDYIVFYSGENGSQYQYRTRTSVSGGTPILNFLSYAQYGKNVNTLKLLVSKDFTGNYDSNAVNSATWTDITSRATLSNGKINTQSGNIDLSDFVSQDTPIYMAFKYTDIQDGINSQRSWTITNLSLINYLPDSTNTTLLNIPNSIWISINLLNTPLSWALSSTYLKIGGGVATYPSSNIFLVSQPVNLTGVLPDKGTPIKSISENPLTSYSNIFKKAGTYTVTFDARNANINSGTGTIKNITLTVK